MTTPLLRRSSSGSRSEALCPHLSECGACPKMLHAYPEQIISKTAKVKEAFVAQGFDSNTLDTLIRDCVPSPRTTKYRNKAKWVLSVLDDVAVAGIYSQGSHDVVPIPNCIVHGPRINQITEFVRSKIVEIGVPVWNSVNQSPGLRHIIVRYSFFQKKSMVVIVTSQKNIEGLSILAQSIQKEFQSEIVSIVQNINKSTGNVVLGEKNRYLYHQGELIEKFGPFTVFVGPLSFLQVNTSMAELIYKKVKQLVGRGPHKIGVDLYSGIGLMGMYLARETESVFAIEEVQAASQAGVVSAKRNGIQNIRAQCGDVAELLDPSHFAKGSVDWLVLNPPRKGCEESVLDKVSQISPKKLVYVSCNPKTLARDSRFLAEKGLKLRSIEPFDMFPQTAHVETVALFSRAND